MATIQITASGQINAPGLYLVNTPGVALTLPVWGGWWNGGDWTVKDATGSDSPAITISASGGGLIDGQASYTMTLAGQSMTLSPSTNGVNWALT